MKLKVKYNVSFEVEIELPDKDMITNAVTNIAIPENDSKYVEDSFEVIRINLNGEDYDFR